MQMIEKGVSAGGPRERIGSQGNNLIGGKSYSERRDGASIGFKTEATRQTPNIFTANEKKSPGNNEASSASKKSIGEVPGFTRTPPDLEAIEKQEEKIKEQLQKDTQIGEHNKDNRHFEIATEAISTQSEGKE